MPWGSRVRPPRKRCRLCPDDRPAVADELCGVHYNRRRRGAVGWDTLPIKRKTGAGWNRAGYRMIYRPDHPNAGKQGAINEHTFVMSGMLGRPLLDHERVHHKNGNRSDNRPENLELWSISQPPGQRIEDKVEWAREILALYGDWSNAA